jgi:hypothetical protein
MLRSERETIAVLESLLSDLQTSLVEFCLRIALSNVVEL